MKKLISVILLFSSSFSIGQLAPKTPKKIKIDETLLSAPKSLKKPRIINWNATNTETTGNTTITNVGISSITLQEAQSALDFHNQARAEVGVPNLEWSADLAKHAQEWADYLAQNGCNLEHRPNSGKWKDNYGENIAMGSVGYTTFLEAVKLWYSEKKDFQNVVLNSSNWYNTGHYSQMIWRNTTQVGIGMAKCANGKFIVVANYNTPGNYMGQKAY